MVVAETRGAAISARAGRPLTTCLHYPELYTHAVIAASQSAAVRLRRRPNPTDGLVRRVVACSSSTRGDDPSSSNSSNTNVTSNDNITGIGPRSQQQRRAPLDHPDGLPLPHGAHAQAPPRAQADIARGSGPGPGVGPTEDLREEFSPDPNGDEAAYQAGRLPSAIEGLNWWCYTVLGLLFITDFTPLGPLLLQGSRDAAIYLAAVQWVLFVLPTLNLCRERGWHVTRVFRLAPCAPRWWLAGLALGPLLWVLTAAVIAARTGTDVSQLAGSAAPDSPTAGLLFGQLLQRPGDPAKWLRVLATSAMSPAVAEELLYRGFLLTAMRQRFGSVDAVAVASALFAAAHLSIPQFFGLTLLGGLCGGLTALSGSVAPAVAAHAAYNATGIGVGVAVAVLAGGGGA